MDLLSGYACVLVCFTGWKRLPSCKSQAGWPCRSLISAVEVQGHNVSLGRGLKENLEEAICVFIVSVGDDHPLCGGRADPDGFVSQIV